MMRVLVILLAMAGAGVTTAQALSPPVPECYGDLDRHGQHIAWVADDLQHGATLTYAETTTHPEKSSFLFEDCNSGTELRVGLTSDQTKDWPKHGERVRDTFYSAIQSDKTYTMRDMRKTFRKAGYTSTLKKHRTESCGCNVFFPQMRGNKALYEARR